MTQKRDSKGRFRKNTCPLKQAKNAVKAGWVSPYKEIITIVIVIWLIVTGLIWLFGDKKTEMQGTRCSSFIDYNETIHEWEMQCVPYNYTYTNHSHYSIPESIIIEYSWVNGIEPWFAGIGNDLWQWLLSHPVI